MATVTLTWNDPEDAEEFTALHGMLRRQGWLPDVSATHLWALTAEATVVREDEDHD